MEAQKNPKMTVRILHQEFNILKDGLIEVKNLKEMVEVLEKRLDDSETKVEVLEKRLDDSETKVILLEGKLMKNKKILWKNVRNMTNLLIPKGT